MAESKIDFSFDGLHFSCEGDKDWVESQLNQILSRIPGLSKSELFVKSENVKGTTSSAVSGERLPVAGKKESNRNVRRAKTESSSTANQSAGGPLYEFLKEKNADKNQVRKFLATAVFLHSQGIEKLSTPMVSKLLKSSHIEKLINASDCLNKNEKKGFCIKDDKEFILTESGIRSIIGGTEE
jgi:hypothetical protein